MTPSGGIVVTAVLLLSPYVLLVAGPAAVTVLLLAAGAVMAMSTGHTRRGHSSSASSAATLGTDAYRDQADDTTRQPDCRDLGASNVAEGEAGDDADLSALADEQLRWAWLHSYHQLLLATEEGTALMIVAHRQAILDELAARDPAGFKAWLDSGALPGSDPTTHRYDPD